MGLSVAGWNGVWGLVWQGGMGYGVYGVGYGKIM